MTEFGESEWAQSEFSQGYRDTSDVFLPYRGQFIETSLLFYEQRASQNPAPRVLDLGCGDGVFAQALLASLAPASITLVDGSSDMLEAARARLGMRANVTYTQASFQTLLATDLLGEAYDFVYSSLAIHHLSFEEKKGLYAYIHDHLCIGACFLNYDVVKPPSERLEHGHMTMWRRWIERHPGTKEHTNLMGVPDQYKANPDNIPDTLDFQLRALVDVGFKDVDCHFKYGMFALFGGMK